MFSVKPNTSTQIQEDCKLKCREEGLPSALMTPGRITSPLKDEIGYCTVIVPLNTGGFNKRRLYKMSYLVIS